MIIIKRETINKHRIAFEGRFIFIDVLGPGATAVVYHCFDKKTGKEVALKIFNDHKELYEVEILKSLNHSNIPKFYESGTINGYHFLSMEYIFGMRLWDCNNELPKLPIKISTKLILTLVDTLKYIHSKGIIHKDVRSENIIISKQGEPYLIDFGTAVYSSFFRADISNLGNVWLNMLPIPTPENLNRIINSMRERKVKTCGELTNIIRQFKE